MSTKITYYVHSTTIDNEQGLATGWAPGELSAKGLKQAQELKKEVQHQQFDAVFCSDLKRAVDTAQIAFSNFPIIYDERLRESNFGDLDRTSKREFEDDLKNYIEKPFPNGESYQDVEKRMRSFVKEIRQKYTGKHIAIVAHQAPQLALDVIVKNKSWKEAIDQDWRKTKSWQAGWPYVLS